MISVEQVAACGVVPVVVLEDESQAVPTAKALLAGVPAELIDTCNVVSAEVAEAMARGTRERLGVDIAVSATGLAGPGGGTPERPVGTVYLGLSTREKTWHIPLRLTGDRMRIRTLAVKHALDAVRRAAR